MTAKRQVTLLVIDDDEDDRYFLRRLARDISQWHIDVLEAQDRAEALNILNHRIVDVIVLDYLLGAETGLDLLDWLCTNHGDCPVVVTTGQGDENIAAEFIKAGAQDYLIKSELTPHLLHRAIDRAMAQTLLQREKALLEDQVRQLHKMEAVSTLAGGLAHDFNNILTGIIGHVQLGQSTEDPKKVRDHLNSIERDCLRMSDIIRRLMSLNEPVNLKRRPISLRQVLDEMTTLIQHRVPEDVRFEVILAPEPLLIEGTVAGLHQVVMNLVDNAIEAMQAGGELTITTGSYDTALIPESMLGDGEMSSRMAFFEVRDTGKGISDEILRRIFEPFFTTKPLTSVKGSGLGLAVVWQVVRSLGGTVRVDSKPGEGSAFLVLLPLAQDEHVESAEPAVAGALHHLDEQ